MQLSIIIINYNVKFFLEQCLHAAVKACEGMDAEVFVVDNNSSDGSRAYLEPKFPLIHFTWNKENIGFGKANNQALAMANGEYILFLNPDTIVAGNSFTRCINYFEKNKQAAALGVHMIDGSGYFLKESKRTFPSPLASLTKVSGLASLFPKSAFFAGYYATNIPENDNGKVDVLAGAFMMVKKKVLDITAGFDDRFFMYGEDIDLSYRIQQAGFESHYFSGTSIIHFKGESTQQNKVTYTRDFYNAMKLFIHKHYRQQKPLYFFMNTAINFAKFIARLKKKPQIKTFPQQPKRSALIASQEAFDKALRLIKYAEPPILVCGRIKTGTEDKGTSLGDIASFKTIVEKNKISTVIFCEKDISYLQMIELMKKNPGYNYLFHANDSSSIAGSRDSHSTGDVIVVNSIL
ncbi:MAG: glycosyltransferase family 2 protein [Ferruginibacter sp.]